MNEIQYALGHDPHASWIVSRIIEFQENREAKKLILNVSFYHALMINVHYDWVYDIEVGDMDEKGMTRVQVNKK
jgi:hypothetical protein